MDNSNGLILPPLSVEPAYSANKKNLEISWKPPSHFTSFKVYVTLQNTDNSNSIRKKISDGYSTTCTYPSKLFQKDCKGCIALISV